MAVFFKDISEIQDANLYRVLIKKAMQKPDGENFVVCHNLLLAEGKIKSRLIVGDISATLLKDLKAQTKGLGGALGSGIIQVDGDRTLFVVDEGKAQYSAIRESLQLGGLSLTWEMVQKSGLQSTPLGKGYAGEDKELGWRAKEGQDRKSDVVRTRYYTPEEKEAHRIHIDEEGDVAGPKAKELTGYVMDPETGDLHTFGHDKDGKDQAFTKTEDGKLLTEHHSSPLAGKAVASAGHIQLKERFIRKLDNASGHYKPEAKYTWQALQTLIGKGFTVEDTELVDIETGRPALQHQRVAQEQVKVATRNQEINIKLLELKDLQDRLEGGEFPIPGVKGGSVEEAEEWLDGQIFDLEDERTALKKTMKLLHKQLSELPQLVLVPSLRETDVEIQGKGLTDQEFEETGYDRALMNALIEEKFGIKNFLAQLKDGDLKSRPYINLLLGNATRLKLKASQFMQTQGNERAAALKQRAMKLIRRMGTEIKPSHIQALEQKIADVERLGGEAKLASMDLPPEEMDVFLQEKVLKGKVNLEEVRQLLYVRLGGDDAMRDLGLDPESIKLRKRVMILSGRLPAEEWRGEWSLSDKQLKEWQTVRRERKEESQLPPLSYAEILEAGHQLRPESDDKGGDDKGGDDNGDDDDEGSGDTPDEDGPLGAGEDRGDYGFVKDDVDDDGHESGGGGDDTGGDYGGGGGGGGDEEDEANDDDDDDDDDWGLDDEPEPEPKPKPKLPYGMNTAEVFGRNYKP